MRNFIIIALILLALPICAQRLEDWQKEFCIRTPERKNGL